MSVFLQNITFFESHKRTKNEINSFFGLSIVFLSFANSLERNRTQQFVTVRKFVLCNNTHTFLKYHEKYMVCKYSNIHTFRVSYVDANAKAATTNSYSFSFVKDEWNHAFLQPQHLIFISFEHFNTTCTLLFLIFTKRTNQTDCDCDG